MRLKLRSLFLSWYEDKCVRGSELRQFDVADSSPLHFFGPVNNPVTDLAFAFLKPGTFLFG